MSYAGVTGSFYSRTNVSTPLKSTGVYCVWGSASAGDILGPNNFDGLMIQDWKVSLKSVSDGATKTLLVGERWYGLRAWMAGAYSTGTSDPSGGTGRGATPLPPSGPQPSTAWFSCKNLTAAAPLNHSPLTSCYIGHVNDYMTLPQPRPGGDRPMVPDSVPHTLSCNDLPFGSFHPGGVNFSFGDGSVKFLNDSLDITAYLAMGSRNGAEAVNEQ
jgi:prepilin-type processing-associated H-X9-DG protein